MSADPQNAKSIFLNAAERTAGAAREAYLSEACGQDAVLRQEVEELLAHFGRVGSFLEPPDATASISAPQASEAIGMVIGKYKLLQQLGEGGMGTVFMAEQTEPVQRKVAVKVIKAGMDSRQVIARFEAERQALALMDHPNIAKVLDAGTTEAGQPYFVMELVKGVPITKYCDERHLTPQQRLELFVPVCQAVQHAHQKGIIHRDIKPSNVMVCLYDGKPVPKVIDFGVAKATGSKLTEKTLFTEIGSVVGTLEYMSPEQAELNQLDVDTRSDIYSLGVLLYELLTGTTPLERRRLKAAAFLEVLRLIREEEAPRPSTRLGTTEGLPSIAANRGLEPKKLSGLMRGELDWIVMKSLDKDRNRRYETANGLAHDIERYLNDETVQACPPSAGYRLKKFARRNKPALAAASLVLLFILLIGGGTGWVVKDRQAQRSQIGREVDTALREAAQLAGERKWAEAAAWVQRAEGVLAGGGGDEELRQRVRDFQADLKAIARTEEIRLLRGHNAGGQLFDVASSDSLYADAFRDLGIDVDALGPMEAGRRLRAHPIAPELAATLDDWAYARFALGRPGWEHLTEVAECADPDPWRNRLREAWRKVDRKALAELAAADEVDRLPPPGLVRLAWALEALGEGDRAVAVLRRAQQRYPGDFWINYALGHALIFGPAPHHPDEATGYFRAAVAVRPESAEARSILGLSLGAQRDLNGAIAAFQQAIAVSPDFAVAHLNLGSALMGQRKLDDAITCFQKALELDPTLIAPHASLGYCYAQLGRWDEAAAEHAQLGHWDEAAAEFERGLELNPANYDHWCLAATLHAARGDLDGYRRTCGKMLARFGDTNQPQQAERMAKACSLLPDALSAADFDRVQKLADRAVAVDENDRLYYWFTLAKGLADYRAGRYAKAVRWLERFPPNAEGNPWDAMKFAILAMAQDGLGSVQDSRASLANAARIISTMPDPGMGQLIPAIFWHDWLHAQVLCREAERRLKKK